MTTATAMSLDQAKALYLKTTEMMGETREVIGGYVVNADATKMGWMTESEFEELQVSLHEEGLIERIELNSNDEIVDGRNRMLACLAQDIEPEFKYAELDSRKLVDIRNLRRRHMDPGRRAMTYVMLHGDDTAEEEPVAVVEKKPAGKKSEASAPIENSEPVKETPKPKKTISEQAVDAGVSQRTMQSAVVVNREGVDEVKKAVAAGELPIHKAEQIVKLPAEAQKEAVEAVRDNREPAKREVSEASFNFESWASSVEKRISKMLASIPPGLRDRGHRRLAESLGSTVRMERETSDLMNSEGVVPYVEQLISEMPKSERAGAEKAIAERYSSVVLVKDSEAALEKINGIIESLNDREKKKIAAVLGQQFKLPVSNKPAEYLPDLPEDLDVAMDTMIKELKLRADVVKGHAEFMSAQSEVVVAELTKVTKKLTLKKG